MKRIVTAGLLFLMVTISVFAIAKVPLGKEAGIAVFPVTLLTAESAQSSAQEHGEIELHDLAEEHNEGEAALSSEDLVVYSAIAGLTIVISFGLYLILLNKRTSRRTSLRVKILGIAIGILLFLVGNAIISATLMGQIEEQLESIANENVEMSDMIALISELQFQQAVHLQMVLKYYYMPGDNLRQIQEQIRIFHQLSNSVDSEIAKAKELALNIIDHETEQQVIRFQDVLHKLEAIEEQHTSYEEHVDEFFYYFEDNRIGLIGEAQLALAEIVEAEIEEEEELLMVLHDEVKEFTAQATALAHHEQVTALNSSIIASVVSIIVGIFFSIVASRKIAKELNTGIDELTSSSMQIANSATQQSSTSEEIASGAAEQASGIEQTTASIEELVSMINQNSENAKHMNQLAIKAAESSKTGSEKMAELYNVMEDLNNSSDEIKSIVKAIDNIAFQTNILALNAAVEAARAGEVGMGFAVVADEVKNLANKSGDSARATAELIEGSLKKIEGSLKLSMEMTELFNEMMNQSEKVTEMSKEVEIASTQQNEGVEQINRAILEFDKVVQSNASASEEAASAAEELSAQAESMNELVELLDGVVKGVSHKSQTYQSSIVSEKEIRRPPQMKATMPKNKEPKEAPASKKSASKKEEPEKKTIVTPEEVIPFEDDEDLQDM